MHSKPTTIKELCKFIWYLEKKYNLLDFEVDGVKVWQFMRMNIYYDLAKKLKILDEPHLILTKIDKIKYMFKYIYNTIAYNPFYVKDIKIIYYQLLYEFNN